MFGHVLQPRIKPFPPLELMNQNITQRKNSLTKSHTTNHWHTNTQKLTIDKWCQTSFGRDPKVCSSLLSISNTQESNHLEGSFWCKNWKQNFNFRQGGHLGFLRKWILLAISSCFLVCRSPCSQWQTDHKITYSELKFYFKHDRYQYATMKTDQTC